jgi:hypothetical protein
MGLLAYLKKFNPEGLEAIKHALPPKIWDQSVNGSYQGGVYAV